MINKMHFSTGTLAVRNNRRRENEPIDSAKEWQLTNDSVVGACCARRIRGEWLRFGVENTHLTRKHVTEHVCALQTRCRWRMFLYYILSESDSDRYEEEDEDKVVEHLY